MKILSAICLLTMVIVLVFPASSQLSRFVLSPAFATAEQVVDFANTLSSRQRLTARFFFQSIQNSPTPGVYYALVDRQNFYRVWADYLLYFSPSGNWAFKWKYREGFADLEQAVSFMDGKNLFGCVTAHWNPYKNPYQSTVTVFYVDNGSLSGSGTGARPDNYYTFNRHLKFSTAKEMVNYLWEEDKYAFLPAQFASSISVANQLDSVWQFVLTAGSSYENCWKVLEYDRNGLPLTPETAVEFANQNADLIDSVFLSPSFSIIAPQTKSRIVFFYTEKIL